MSWSFSIGKIAGTEVRIHYLFLLLVAWYGIAAGIQGGQAAAIEATLFILAVFACVLLHEYGHVLTARRYGIEVEMKKPATTVEQYEQLHGGPLYRTNPDQCCFDRKVTVLKNAVVGFHAWASAIRRDQSPDRANVPIVGWDKKFSLVKVSPLAKWTKQDVWKFITDHDVPYNPLHDQGFTSIGCWPCTRAVLAGEDERAGRWSGTAKTECGLHSLDK